MSIALFAILFFAITFASNHVVKTVADFETLMPWFNAITIFLYVIAGFVAGMVAKRRMIPNGLVAGGLAAATAITAFGVTRGDAEGIGATIIIGGVLGGIGGACAMFLARRKENIKSFD